MMTLLTKMLLFATAGAVVLTELRSAEPVRLRALSYNIHHGVGVDEQLDLGRIARVIVSARPDIVALQEVDCKARRSNSIDQPTELARLTEMNVAFGANIELQGGHYGNVVLSRFPIISRKNHPLPNLNEGEPRGVLATKIIVPGIDDPLLLFATHFDHRRDDSERVLSANAVNAMVQTETRPALLMGDLNDVIGSKTLKQLAPSWLGANGQPQPTIPVVEPRRQIDFVLYRPANRWRLIDTQVLDESVASDHRAIISVLELLPDRN